MKKGYQTALILEDDIAVASASSTRLDLKLAELPKDWDVLYLGCRDNHTRITIRTAIRIWITYPILNLLGFKKFNRKKLRLSYPRSYSRHLQLAGWHFGTYAYSISAEGAKKILALQTPISLAADNVIGLACRDEAIKAFKFRQKVFHQSEQFTSTIEGRKRPNPKLNKRLA